MKICFGTCQALNPPRQNCRRSVSLTSGCGHHAGRYFFIAQGSRACGTAKDDCLPHAAEAQQMRFHFCGVHLFTRDVDHIRNPADDFESRTALAPVDRLGRKFRCPTFRYPVPGNSRRPQRRCAREPGSPTAFGSTISIFDAFHRFANKSFARVSRFAIIANPAAFRCAVKRVDRQVKLFQEFLRDWRSGAARLRKCKAEALAASGIFSISQNA